MSEKARIAALEKERARAKEEHDRQLKQLASDLNKDRTASSRFTSRTDDIEETLKLDTVGLHNLEEFKEKKRLLEEQRAREAARTDELKALERKKRKKTQAKNSTLSFAGEEEADGEETAFVKPIKKVKKNPTVDTSFLPDREREEQERKQREELRQQYLKRQEEIKLEPITIIFSYWDGTGHRSDVECKKGDTIATFLDKARSCFPEIKNVSVDNLLYVKEDLIIPHHYTFYDFIVSKARGKSGPLFHFDAHEDVRLLADATKEKEESHAGKVVERNWYNRNKHIFPQSRWEAYQKEKDYGAYRRFG